MFRKIFLLFFLVLFLNGVLYAETSDGCKFLYENGQYEKASTCYYSLLLKDKNNPSLKLYYGNSLFAEKRYNSAKLQYNDIIQKYPNTAAAYSAKKKLAILDNMLRDIKTSRTNDSGSYISEISQSKWRYMPIKVWIESGTYKLSARKAFMEWQTKTQGLVRFSFVEKASDAQIVVTFSDNIASNSSGDALGVTNITLLGGKYVNHADMLIKTTTRTGSKQSTSQIYSVVLHEVGHALGIRGHSSNKYDVMYPSDDNYRNVLSNRDINTVKTLYK